MEMSSILWICQIRWHGFCQNHWALFTWDRDEVKPTRIPKFASYLHEIGTKSFRGDFVSVIIVLIIYIYTRPDRKLLRPDWSHSACWTESTMFRPEWNLFEFTFIPLWSHTGLNIVGPAGGITSDRSEQFSSLSHVNIYYKDYYDRNEIAPVWLRPALHFSNIFHSMKIHNCLNQNLESITLPIIYTISLLWILDQSFTCVIS